MELKRIETLREGELAQVAAPWYAITKLKTVWLGHGGRIQGYDKALEACTDPQRRHWDYQRHGFERLCEQVNDGDLMLVLDKSWPPLAPAYAQVNGKWQLTQYIAEPRLRQRLESQLQTTLRAQRETEALQSRNQPSSAEVQTELASGPGNRAASLGPHVGGEANRTSSVVSQTSVPENFGDAYAKAPMAKAEIDFIADDLARGAGGTVAKAPIKSRERSIEKINSDYGGDAYKIKDIARNTIVVPPEKISTVAAQLKARGADVKIIDGANNPLGYSGVNATMMTKAGIPAEIQVNSPVMIYAKESEKNARSILGNDKYNQISSKVDMPGGQGHQIYEQWRVLKPDSSEAKALAEQSKSYYDAIRGVSVWG